ncbi:MAG: DUF5711 family protein [Bacillota bacterium]|nr:DUF5711 family protein [Bacillota bacterium]
MERSEKEKQSNLNTGDVESSGQIKVRNVLLFFILVLIVACTAAFTYLKSKNVDMENMSVKEIFSELVDFSGNEQKGKVSNEIKFDANEKHVFATYKGLIIESIKDSVKALNEAGEEQWVVTVSAGNPVIKTAGSYMLIADLTGKDVYLLNGGEIKWNRKMNGNIINADVNSSGFVSVVREEKGYKGAITIINKKGNDVLSRTIAGKFVYMSKVSPSGKQFLINGLDASGVKSQAVVELNNMNDEKANSLELGETSLLPYAGFLDNGDLVATGDSAVYSFDTESKMKWKLEFPNNKIICSDILSGDSTVLALSEEDSSGKVTGNKTDIYTINKSGEKKLLYSIDSKVKNIKTYSGVIAINTGTTVYYINGKGALMDKFDSKISISDVYFLSRHKTVLVGKNSIVINNI